ncbi:MAG: cellobiose phosphorylase [Candidatus Omnitrophica bacterium CG1_02_49_16]|nr:MAG: cellobiose phosphorylase [Candidatus Omnitrophica bacterium CG1_02_49_16]
MPNKNSLWQFIDEGASFRVLSPESTSRLYFPLANEGGILSSITPDLHGDIKTNHNAFLMLPVTAEDLHNSKSSRNFWVYVQGQDPWSLTGVSAIQHANKFSHKRPEKVCLEAGLLWHKIIRENDALGLKSEITNFVPPGRDAVELMIVSLTNISPAQLKLTATSAIPIFGRSADNVRDHRHVTSLLHRIISHRAGVVVKPTMSFDERGHKINETLYAVLGADNNGEPPLGAFTTVADFIGEGGNLEAPQAIFENLAPPQGDESSFQGKSAIGALRFKTVALAPHAKIHFVMLLGIAAKPSELEEWLKKYGSPAKAEAALEENKKYWSEKISSIQIQTHDKNYDGWTRWVSVQPTLRKIFGCSFLPEFDYGRGGRGWRDLWQDCLALLLSAPAEAKALLINNFNGIRMDGSNATIIGTQSGEFIADRNHITRVWMDHGVWPYLTLELYIHQTGDFDILFHDAYYFRDAQQSRAREKDPHWDDAYGKNLKTHKGAIVQSSILEHMLVQHLVQFFNVGEHNHIRLENADWNDGLDMAYDRGESVAFTMLYGSNLRKLASMIEEVAARKRLKKIVLCKELLMLLDRASGKKVNYNSFRAKVKRLEKYFDAVQPEISGKKIEVKITKLVQDLKEKSDFITEHVRQKEWIVTHDGHGLYNGYYDNHGRRVEGDFPLGLRMTLAGQVFSVTSGIATSEQVTEIFKTVSTYLKDKEHGGFRLNTNFHQIRPDLGRAFSFAYGEKENGAFFSHMAVMFASALYQRGFVNEGREVLDSIFTMCLNTEKSKIYPGIPEYFNSEGRGLYHYLTGSASWLVMTLLTQVFGVRGIYGDLLLSPKITKAEFHQSSTVNVTTQFAGKRFKVIYQNLKKIPYEYYYVSKVSINGKILAGLELNKKEVLIKKELLLKYSKKSLNVVVVTLE